MNKMLTWYIILYIGRKPGKSTEKLFIDDLFTKLVADKLKDKAGDTLFSY